MNCENEWIFMFKRRTHCFNFVVDPKYEYKKNEGENSKKEQIGSRQSKNLKIDISPL